MDHKEFEQALCKKLGTTPDKATPQALHSAIGDTVMETIAPDWRASRQAHLSGRRACYFSMEFLVGRAVQNNLLCWIFTIPWKKPCVPTAYPCLLWMRSRMLPWATGGWADWLHAFWTVRRL